VPFHAHYILSREISLNLASPFYKTGHKRQKTSSR
jgi:hypothetical protein